MSWWNRRIELPVNAVEDYLDQRAARSLFILKWIAIVGGLMLLAGRLLP